MLPLLLVPVLSGPLLTSVLFLRAALCVGDAATILRLFRQTSPRITDPKPRLGDLLDDVMSMESEIHKRLLLRRA